MALKSQNQSYSLRFVRNRENFRNPFCAKLVITYPNCDNLIQNNEWNLWKFTRKFWNCEAPPFTDFLVSTVSKINTRYRWPADHFAFHLEHLFGLPSLNSLHQCLTVPSLTTFCP
jgi:hypothetical protein